MPALYTRAPVRKVRITQEFAAGNAWDKYRHLGLDLGAVVWNVPGDEVFSPGDGFCVWAAEDGVTFPNGNPWEQIPGNGNGGGTVIIQHVAPHQAAATQLNHLQKIVVKVGDWLPAGTLVGYMGYTGFTVPKGPEGTHLHMETFIDYGNGQYPDGTDYGRVNPLDYFEPGIMFPVAPGATGSSGTKGGTVTNGIIVDWRGRTAKHSGVSGIPTQLLVLHSAESPLRAGYAQSLSQWCIDNPGIQSSWHRFVDPIARVMLIDDSLAAWHASEANPMSIGWEQAGYARFSRAEWTTPDGMKQLMLLAEDMAGVAVRDGIPAVWLTTDQVTAITSGRDRTTKGFCIHAQIDPDMRTDPGSGYPYDLLMTRIKQIMGLASESELTVSEAAKIITMLTAIQREQSNIKGVLINGYVLKAGGPKLPGIVAIVTENQRRINALTETVGKLPHAIWQLTTIFRGGKKVPVLQELANNTTTGEQTQAAVAALKAIVEQSATGKQLGAEEIQGIIRQTADETAKTFADNTISVKLEVGVPEQPVVLEVESPDGDAVTVTPAAE